MNMPEDLTPDFDLFLAVISAVCLFGLLAVL